MTQWQQWHGKGSSTHRAQQYSPSTSEWKRDPSGLWHYVGVRSQMGPAHRLWTCAGCKSTNHSKNACTTCGMRRTWAEAVKNSHPSPPQQDGTGNTSASPAHTSSGNQVQQQLKVVAEKLAKSAGMSPLSPSPVVPPAAAASPPGGVPAAPEDTSTTRGALVESIKQLEVSLSTLPQDSSLDGARAAIQFQLDSKRKQLGELRPLGKRLDGARAALERAQKRHATAEESLQLATQAVKTAADEVAQLRKDVAELEKQVAAAPPSTAPAPPAQSTIDELTKQMEAAVHELAQFGSVSPEALREAQAQSEAILAKFKATLEHAVQTCPPRRAQGKQAPTMLPVRHNGKQAPKRYITDWFTRASTDSQVFQKDSDDISDM